MKVPGCAHGIHITHELDRPAYRLQHGGNPEHSKLVDDYLLPYMGAGAFEARVLEWIDSIHRFEARGGK